MSQAAAHILFLIKWVAISQLILIFCFVLLSYIRRSYLKYEKRQNILKIKKTKQRWISYLSENQKFSDSESLNPEHLPLYHLLGIIKQMDQKLNTAAWKEKRYEIIQIMILPKARALSHSKDWFNRYTACQAFELDSKLDPNDEPIIKNLIYDEVPLIALDAQRIAICSNSQMLIDAIVDCFSQARHVQQSFYAGLLPKDAKTLAPLFAHKLTESSSPYAKAFCYRVLSVFTTSFQKIASLDQDIHSDNLELKLSALEYIALSEPNKAEAKLQKALQDTKWEVRAKAANLLGKLHIVSSAYLLEKTLKDDQWWVRINSAEALFKLGEPGIKILKAQAFNKDRYAYEAAQSVLLRMQVKNAL